MPRQGRSGCRSEKGSDRGEPKVITWTGGIFPPSTFVISPKCAISGKCLLVMEMGAFSISLAHTGRIPHREAARGNTPIPSKRLPSLMSGMARGAVSLHGKHPFPVWSPQCPAARQPQYHFLHPRPQRCRRQSGCGSAAAYPGAYQSRPCVPRERCHSKTAADTRAGRLGKSPPS